MLQYSWELCVSAQTTVDQLLLQALCISKEDAEPQIAPGGCFIGVWVFMQMDERVIRERMNADF